MIDYLPMSRLINIMSSYNFFYIIKYSNGDYEIISKKSKEIAKKVNEYNKHFYFIVKIYQKKNILPEKY